MTNGAGEANAAAGKDRDIPDNVTPLRPRSRAGLVLTGGGARAAFQVGVVKAVRDILGNPVKNPFPILVGTSAGAINAATLAVYADNFTRGVGNLLEVWENMRVDHVYRADFPSILKSGARWLSSLMLISRRNPMSLLDNAPLAEMLEKTLPFLEAQIEIRPDQVGKFGGGLGVQRRDLDLFRQRRGEVDYFLKLQLGVPRERLYESTYSRLGMR